MTGMVLKDTSTGLQWFLSCHGKEALASMCSHAADDPEEEGCMGFEAKEDDDGRQL